MRYWAVPSLFWWNSTDMVLTGACWAAVLSAVLLAGYLERLALVLLYVLYLSFSLAGQDFLSFQWDALLLETGFLAIFFGHSGVMQKTVAWLYRWLAFRLYFLSGFVKLSSGDPNWRGLSALDFHYYTQPLPTIVAWYADKLPRWFQHASTFTVLAVELGAPFLISRRGGSAYLGRLAAWTECDSCHWKLYVLQSSGCGDHAVSLRRPGAARIGLDAAASKPAVCARVSGSSNRCGCCHGGDSSAGSQPHLRQRWNASARAGGGRGPLHITVPNRQFLRTIRGDDDRSAGDYRRRIERRPAMARHEFPYKPGDVVARHAGWRRISPASTGRCGSPR
jgi:hypothetical protein